MEGEALPGLYATGWVKRGPVGLIGSTKSDARQTIGHVVADAEAGVLVSGAERAGRSGEVGGDALLAALDKAGVRYTTWQGWELLDTFERDLGGAWVGDPLRERIKVVDRETMTAIARGEQHEGRLY